MLLNAMSKGSLAEAGPEAARQRNLMAVSVAAFLASVGFMVVMPLLPGLIREVVGGDVAASSLWLGLAISVSPLLTALTGPLWNVLASRFGHKAMIERSLVCIGLGIGLLALATSAYHVVALRAVIGGLGGVSVAALAAVTASTPRRQLGPAVGTLQAAQTAGAMVGPALGGALGGLIGMREAFVVSGAVLVAALGLVHWLYRETGPAATEQVMRAGRGDARARTRGLGAGMIVALVAAFVIQFVEGGLLVLLPLELERLGLASDRLPMVLGVGLSAVYLAATLAALVAGRLSANRSPVTLLAWTLIASLAALVPLSFAASWGQFLGLRIALSLVVGAAPTLAYAAAATLALPEQRGKMVALMSSAGIMGWALSPITAGILAQNDPGLLLRIDVALYVLMAGALLAADRGLFAGLPRVLPRLGELPHLLPNVAVPRQLIDWLPNPGMFLKAPSARRYTADEVVSAMRGRTTGPRAKQIIDIVARPWEWMPADGRCVLPDLPRHSDRMATILMQYGQGRDPEQISRSISALSGRWAVERTVRVAAELVANRLNR